MGIFDKLLGMYKNPEPDEGNFLNEVKPDKYAGDDHDDNLAVKRRPGEKLPQAEVVKPKPKKRRKA